MSTKKWSYYNDIDPFACEWTRQLIKKKIIPDGEVDERSIWDIQPNELVRFSHCHFCNGIAVWAYALRQAGWPDDRECWTGSMPCQPFSAAGKKGGFADERHLWPAFFHLISQCKPVTVFGEQVASKDGLAWLDIVQSDLEAAGYTVGAADIPACGLGAPHIRNRLWFVADMHGGEQRGQPRETSREGKEIRIRNCAYHDNGGESGIVADAGSERDRRELRYRYGEEGAAESRRKAGAGATETRDSGNPRFVADLSGERCGETRERGGRPEKWIGDSGEPHLMADTERDGRHTRRAERAGQFGASASVDGGATGELANTTMHGHAPADGLRGQAEPPIEAGENGIGKPSGSCDAGPTNGFWADAEWLPCRDGKHRPTGRGIHPLVGKLADAKSGKRSEPEGGNGRTVYGAGSTDNGEWTTQSSPITLVNGTPESVVRVCDPGEEVDANNTPEARVMRLKGYGNCINSEVAIAFISAYIEVMGIKP